ncbi:hypothetical protein DM450_07185 [Sphingomonas sp. IC081]|nr:hypothetical protein DM450_07185 [Sphingomonas sp. IC081]
MSPALLVAPAQLPKVQRSSVGTMDGADAHNSLTALYDVAGQIRATLIELQAQVRTAMGGTDAEGR